MVGDSNVPTNPAPKEASHLDSPRIRFNWGFHDAALDHKMGWGDRRQGGHARPLPAEMKADDAYRTGYGYGYEAAKAGKSTESSEAAWRQAKAPKPALVKCPRCAGSGDLCVGCSGVGSDPMDDAKGVYFGSCGNVVDCSVCDGEGKVPAGTKCLDVLTRRMVVA